MGNKGTIQKNLDGLYVCMENSPKGRKQISGWERVERRKGERASRIHLQSSTNCGLERGGERGCKFACKG